MLLALQQTQAEDHQQDRGDETGNGEAVDVRRRQVGVAEEGRIVAKVEQQHTEDRLGDAIQNGEHADHRDEKWSLHVLNPMVG